MFDIINMWISYHSYNTEAYNYWRIEENVEARLRELVDLVREIFEDEMKQYYNKCSFLKQSEVLVYEPENGEVAVELHLPIPLSSLKEIPDTSAYVDEAKDIILDYTPSLDTMSQIYEDYFPTIFAANGNETESPKVQSIHMPTIRNVRRQRRRRGF